MRDGHGLACLIALTRKAPYTLLKISIRAVALSIARSLLPCHGREKTP